MGRRTVLSGENMTLTTGIRILAAISTAAAGSAAAVIKVRRVEISQNGSTTLGMIRGAFSTRTGSTLTGAAGLAPVNIDPIGGPVSGLTASTAPAAATARSGIGNFTTDTTPTYVDQHQFNFANLNGYLWKPAPDEEITIPASTVWVVRFLADPGTLTGWTISLWLDES